MEYLEEPDGDSFEILMDVERMRNVDLICKGGDETLGWNFLAKTETQGTTVAVVRECAKMEKATVITMMIVKQVSFIK